LHRERTVKQPIVVHTEEDYDAAQRRVEELNAEAESPTKHAELAALAEAMLAWELRREEALE
jgi:tRNA(Arg) A34 adenosine deaminase TadA